MYVDIIFLISKVCMYVQIMPQLPKMRIKGACVISSVARYDASEILLARLVSPDAIVRKDELILHQMKVSLMIFTLTQG